MGETLIPCPRACTAVQDMAGALLGRIDGDEVDALCSTAFGEPFVSGDCVTVPLFALPLLFPLPATNNPPPNPAPLPAPPPKVLALPPRASAF